MVDAHNVMKGIKHCIKPNCYGCPYHKDNDWHCIVEMHKDVLELLIDLIGERRLDTEVEHETD